MGFTLVELLVVVAILAILVVVSIAGVQAAILQAHKAQAVGAARNLITAYLAAVDPNSGNLMAGYDRTINSLEGPEASRFPVRPRNVTRGGSDPI